MKNSRLQKSTMPHPVSIRTYTEVVEYLDAHWKVPQTGTKSTALKALDAAFSNVTQAIPSVIISGTNGKSLTAHFTARLLQEENLKVGILYAPHILTYNERFAINGEHVNNKSFADVANEIINEAENLDLSLHTSELLLIIGFEYFKQNNVDIVVIETQGFGNTEAATICNPKVVGITRVIDPANPSVSKELITEALAVVKPGTTVISADQSKQSLQIMQKITKDLGAQWSMPIRKVASLPYPFEQLHGRCAALAERIASMYINSISKNIKDADSDSLLVKKKGLRGRPTLEVKRQNELNPPRTVNEFWGKTINALPARFQLLDKEKPSILLDNASNLDSIENVLLGIRLLHYQRSFKGLAIIIGCNDTTIDMTELLKMLRYFFKKTSGQVIVCPITPLAGHKNGHAWNAEKLANDLRGMKIKARSAENFEEAFVAAKEVVDERHGLVVITGSNSIISEYWKFKGMKKI